MNNLYHFIFDIKENDRKLYFINYISVYSTYLINNPDVIYFYYFYEPEGTWWERLKLIPNLKLEKIVLPTHIGNKEISDTKSKVEWIKINTLYKRGGIYLDLNTICLKPWKDLSNKDVILEKIFPDNISNAFMFTKPKSEFLKLWLDRYKSNFNHNEWEKISITLPKKIAREYPDLIELRDCDLFFLPHHRKVQKIFVENGEIPSHLSYLHLCDTSSEKYLEGIKDWYWAYQNKHTIYGKILIHLLNNFIFSQSNYYLAHKEHFDKNINNLKCINTTFLKKSLLHSDKLDNNMKMEFKKGNDIQIINDFNECYYLVNLEKYDNSKTKNNRNFYGFWDSNERVSDIQLTQIKLWAKSLIYFHKNADLFLYTKKNVIPEGLLNIDKLNIVYVNQFEELFKDTPFENCKIPNNLSKPELSDIIRLILLYKNGGTWLDMDDVVVREFPKDKNIIGTFLWENNKNKANYFGSSFNLVDGSLVSSKYNNYGFHIQNDPMINWEKGNQFLYKWMEEILNYSSSDWGQKVPTEIIRKNTNIIKQHNINLLPQHHLLLHPAFGSQAQFGNLHTKGPMFPPYDLRITGNVNYDDMITIEEFWEVASQTLHKHNYCCVKNSKNTGIKQCIEGKDRRWFIGHLCNLQNIENILDKFNNINKKDTMISKILFSNEKMGIFPYKNYNCSIIKLTKEETFEITNKTSNQESILIIFFVASQKYKMGTMSFIGIISYKMFMLFLQDETLVNYEKFWIIKPHLLQNDKGPKCADLRIYKIKKKIGVIGYSRLAPESNTPGIADYYVRVSLLDTRINDKLYEDPDELYHFNEIDGGCFPSKIGNNYKKFTLNNDNCEINNIEFLIKDNETSKLVTPHKSKNNLMPDDMRLNGIEVSFSKKSTNEESTTHISTKNIIPIQHINYLDNICGFIDITPPDSNNPNITIQNVEMGEVLFTSNLFIDDKFISKMYRGTTPFIELNCKLWITMAHKRNESNGLMYNYYYQIYDFKEIMIGDSKISIPNKCIEEIKFDERKIFSNNFIFIMGMIIDEQLYLGDSLKLKIILSYGISDMVSGISLVNQEIKIPKDNIFIQ